MVPGRHFAAGWQRDHPYHAGRGGSGGRGPVPDAGGQRDGHRRDSGRPGRVLPPRCRRSPRAPGLCPASHLAGRAHRPRAGACGVLGGGGIRGVRRVRGGRPGLRRAAALGGPGRAARGELGPEETAPAGGAGRNFALAARRDQGVARQAVVAGAAALRRPSGVRLPVPADGAAGDRQPPAPLADPGGVRSSRHHRDDPHYTRRSRARRGEPDRAAGACRSGLQPGCTGHAHLPDRLLLGAALRRADRLRPVPDPAQETRETRGAGSRDPATR